MKVEYINPFVAATATTFKTMFACPLNRGQLRCVENDQPEHEVSGIIELSGKATGTVVLSIDREVAFHASQAMLGEQPTSINEDVIDMVGELANMIAGAAKAKLEEFEMSVSLPNVIVGTNHVIDFPADSQPICIPFQSPWGSLCLQVSLVESSATSEVA